ncbi:MAG TPA: isochorismatase family protein [Candidatus Hydrogenedentes bacterium]|nr:isochorismatase family protein [Candidatus Hydrogenedentota bacterium]HPG66804.1 isochorismatase family protein [Candidatus Hydrogenedentota bacterium]
MMNREETALVVIDFQEKLLPRIFNADTIVEEAIRLIRFAHLTRIPLILTEQYPNGLGRTVSPVADAVGTISPIEKTSFGCFGEDGFVRAVTVSRCRQLLVVGIETHVCVMQTVIEGLARDLCVFAVQDAMGSRRPSDHSAGLTRMAGAGAQLVTAEMAIFELLRDAASPEFKKVLPLVK